MSAIISGDSLYELKKLETDSVDLVCTDPPYGYSFMGKDWDKAVPSVEIWKECLRVLKPGAFCFVMSAPRSDVQNAMISRLMQAGFRLDFTPIYWTYASGFPKAGNIGKMVDKRGGQYMGWFADYLKEELQKRGMVQKELAKHFPSKTGGLTGCAHNWIEGKNIPTPEQFNKICEVLELPFDNIQEAEREVTGKDKNWGKSGSTPISAYGEFERKDEAKSPQAKALDGSYAGFQPKPAVEVIIVAMKPLSEKTYVDQALKNGKGITWLDDCRIPTSQEDLKAIQKKNDSFKSQHGKPQFNGVSMLQSSTKLDPNPVSSLGRFPGNLIVSDDVLNGETEYSRYFDLDKWASTLPFLITPKASKREKNKGLEHLPLQETGLMDDDNYQWKDIPGGRSTKEPLSHNSHPTVKPLKLMSYLITLGSRPGDTVLDPFVGSGTTVVAAKSLGRNGVGIERETEYAGIAKARIAAAKTPEEQQADGPQISLL